MPMPNKPTKLKMLQGNPGHRPLNKDEPDPLAGEIVCPDWLSESATRIFLNYQPILEGMRVMTVADVNMLALLAATEDEFIALERLIREEGRTTRIVTDAGEKWAANPAVAQRSDAAKRLKMLMGEFGLSPASRTRIVAQKPVEEDDPFARYERQA